MKTTLKLLTIILSFFTVTSFAQSAKVQGVVTTTSGEAIVKTTVKLLNTNYGDITDNQGRYSINNLAGGNYTISISAA